MQTQAHCLSTTIHCPIAWEHCYSLHPNYTEDLNTWPIFEYLFISENTKLSWEQMQTGTASHDELPQEKENIALANCWRCSHNDSQCFCWGTQKTP